VSAALGLAGAAVVVAAAARRAPVGRRPLPRPAPPAAPGRGALDRLGAPLARRLGVPTTAGTARLLAAGLLGGLVLVPLAAPVGVALPAGAAVRAVLQARRRRRDADRAVLQTLPDAVDLLLLATVAGTGLALAQGAVAAKVPGPVGVALRRAEDLASRGTPRADALVASLGPLGERAAALGHVLADHLRYGTPLAPELDRLGLELRLHRRRRAEEEARRVPVRLLAPLVACTLPAFAVLTVVPLLVASLQRLPA